MQAVMRRRSDGWRKATVRWLPPVCWALLILSLSTVPEMYFGTPRTRETRRVHYYLEVMVHVFQFGVFILLMIRALRSVHRSRAWVLGWAFVAVLVLSLTNESLQTLTPTRTFDLVDMAMDVLGAVLGLSFALFVDAT